MTERICVVDGCVKPLRSSGWCDMHYRRWWKHASVADPRPATFPERLMSRFTIQPSGCWEWQGTLTWGGYGQIGRDGTNVPAHRAMWEHLREPIPPGLCIDHLCGDRRCVNPDHLEVVTYSVNNLRRRPPVGGWARSGGRPPKGQA